MGKKNEKDLMLPITDISEEMYGVEITTWENGSGSSDTICICKNMKDAALIVEALKNVFPKRFGVTCGDKEKIDRKININIDPQFRHNVVEFIKDKW